MNQQDKQAREHYLAKLRVIKEGAAANPFETEKDRLLRIERAKKDVKFFVEYYLTHYASAECADFQIELANKVAKNKTCRELVRWGRGLAKSVWCDLIIPLWLWVRGESLYMVIVGNNYDKAVELLSDIQAEFEANARLIHDFGEQQFRGNWENGNFSTRDNRFRGRALGMGQSPRGLRKGSQRPNLIIPDDLEDKDTVKNEKRQDEVVEWIEKDLIPTMDGETRRYLHPNNDFAPRTIQNQLQVKHPKWNVHEVKAYDKSTYKPAWHQKYSDTYYKEIEADIGIIAAHSEYLNEPTIEGEIFKKELIQWADIPKLHEFKMLAAHWDVAYSGNNDYNAVKVWGLHGINFWQIKAFVRQCKMEDAIRFMYDFEDTLPKNIIITWRVESQFWNKPVKDAIADVRRERGRWLNIAIVERPKSNKYTRMMLQYPYYQNGRIYYNKTEIANNDMQTGLKQLYGLRPKYTTHDDSPDADQQAIEYLSEFVSYSEDEGGAIEMGGSRRNNKY